jgi:hypothetical protein
MFGYQIGFNVEGEEAHNTVPGACVSLFIVAWLIVVLRYLIIVDVQNVKDRPLTIKNFENYYGATDTPIRRVDGLFFAVGVSSLRSFVTDTEQAGVNLENYGFFQIQIVQNNGDQTTQSTVVSARMHVCTEDDWTQVYPSRAGQDATIAAHKSAGQFFCPDEYSEENTLIKKTLEQAGQKTDHLPTFSWQIFNRFDSLKSWTVEIVYKACRVADTPGCKTND